MYSLYLRPQSRLSNTELLFGQHKESLNFPYLYCTGNCFLRVVLVYDNLMLWKCLPRAIFCCMFSLFSCSGRKSASSFEVWKSGTILESCEVKLLADNPFVWLLSSGLIISLLESLVLGTCPLRFLMLCLILVFLCSSSEQLRESGFNVCSSEIILESWEVEALPDLFEHIISVGRAWSKTVCFVVALVGFGLTDDALEVSNSRLLVEACEVELFPWRSREPESGGMDEISPFLEVTNSEVVLESGDVRFERNIHFCFFPFLQAFCRNGCNILHSTNAMSFSDSNHKWLSLRLYLSRIFLLCRSKRLCDKEHSQAVFVTTDGQMWRYGHALISHWFAGFE